MIILNDFQFMNPGTLYRSTRTMNNQSIFTRAGVFCCRIIAVILFGATAVAGLNSAFAANSAPPNFLTYQGYLADGNGAPLGAATPINYPVVFRIYDSQTGGNLIWSELQTVTVDNGQFSVVLGEGAANGNEIRPGNVLEHNGGLWAAVKVDHVKPGKGGAFAQVEMKNLRNGSKLNERFRSADKVERVRLEQHRQLPS